MGDFHIDSGAPVRSDPQRTSERYAIVVYRRENGIETIHLREQYRRGPLIRVHYDVFADCPLSPVIMSSYNTGVSAVRIRDRTWCVGPCNPSHKAPPRTSRSTCNLKLEA